MLQNQSDASKSIKRINQRLKELHKLQAEENPYISPYSRAIHETGLEYKQTKTGQYIIRNTAENRQRVAELEKQLKKLHAKTVTDIKKSVREELHREADALAAKKPKHERKKFVREYTSHERQKQRLFEKLEDITISEKLQVIYNVDNTALGDELRGLTQGRSKSDYDDAAIYNAFGRINERYREIQQGQLTAAENQRKNDLRRLYRNFGGFKK